MSRTFLVTLLLSLSMSVACGVGPSTLTNCTPNVREVQAVERVQTSHEPFTAGRAERLVLVYDADTVQAPEWSVSSGMLMANGQRVTWVPEAGRAQLSVTLTLVDGRKVTSVWAVDVLPAPSEP